jgi:transposase
MLTALILVCSLATVSNLGDCTRENALNVIYVPATFASPVTCLMHAQAYVADSSIGRDRWDSQGFVNERVWRHDSILRGQSMPRPYSNDLRARVIEAIEAGASRREVADRYELSPSVVVIWAQRWEETGSVAAKPSGGSTSPLEEHAEFLLRLIVEQPDSTLDEIVAAMRKKRIPGSRSAVWRFFERRNISFKKNFVRDGAKTRGNRPRAPALDAAARHV